MNFVPFYFYGEIKAGFIRIELTHYLRGDWVDTCRIFYLPEKYLSTGADKACIFDEVETFIGKSELRHAR